MSNDDTRRELITRLITGLIDDERRLELDSVVLPRRVNWRAKVDINDTGKLIGKQAAHLYSLRCLINLMGAKFSEDWRLEVSDPDDGERIDKGNVPASDAMDPRPTLNFLEAIVDAILHDKVDMDAVPTTGHFRGFKFVLRPSTRTDLETLLTKLTVGRVEITPVAAIGTLFRAYGRQQGVSFTIEVPSK